MLGNLQLPGRKEWARCPLAPMQASRHGHVDVVKLLLKWDALPAARDQRGDTPAHLAARHRHLEALSALLQVGEAGTAGCRGARAGAAGQQGRQMYRHAPHFLCISLALQPALLRSCPGYAAAAAGCRSHATRRTSRRGTGRECPSGSWRRRPWARRPRRQAPGCEKVSKASLLRRWPGSGCRCCISCCCCRAIASL